MNEQKTTWIDMTDLSVWSGHFTGIQRVVYNIAKEYHASGKANFFTFDPDKRTFHEFDFTSFIELIESNSNRNSEVLISKKALLKNKAKKAYEYSPDYLKMYMTPSRMKSMAKKGHKQYRRIKKIQSKIKTLYSTEQLSTLTFSEGQKVLILGNTWDRPSLLTTLSRLKDEHRIEIYQVVYDLIPVFQPQAFNEELFNVYTKNMFEVATISDGVVAISESSKKDFQKFCKELSIPAPPVSVMRLGDDIPSSESPTPPKGVSEHEPFVISVGTIEARKNHALLYYAWKEGIRNGIDMPRLIIIGRRGWYTEDIIHTIKSDPQTKDKIIILNNVSDDELVWLYRNCLFTVYPSYYEGWGLPVAESLAMGKVCLTSNVSSLPEAGGEFCAYHSPFNSGECLSGIISLLDTNNRIKMESKISSSYVIKSWKDTYYQFSKFVDLVTQ